MKRVVDLSHTDVKQFFLKEESYYNFDLPKYFVFENLLQKVIDYFDQKEFSNFYPKPARKKIITRKQSPAGYEDVNYKFLSNKDGKFAWRPFQLIHPELYVSLVNIITEPSNWNAVVECFKQFQSNPNIRCSSIPLRSQGPQSDKATSVSQWWLEVEQQSLELALKYEYVLHTDISDCYGSIYTHSIPWALHTKQTAKREKNNLSLVGNAIDKHLQDMAYGQTNGIPQGSVLMDFIAEIVLGYADDELSKKIEQAKIQDYEIIRYRDDYRIFSNSPQTIENITKLLTETLIQLGMQLNPVKTVISNNVIVSSIKPDKLYWISSKRSIKNLQEHLLLIHKLSEEHPNSGSLVKALEKFYSKIENSFKTNQNINVLISILVDIMYKSPRTYPIGTAILSKLLSLLSDKQKRKDILERIVQKFQKIPNTGHLMVWLQRITIKMDRKKPYPEKLCEKVYDPSVQIWNSDWLVTDFRKIIDETPIIDENIIQNMDEIITSEEVELFKKDYGTTDMKA